eukprot:gene13450-546_t
MVRKVMKNLVLDHTFIIAPCARAWRNDECTRSAHAAQCKMRFSYFNVKPRPTPLKKEL